MAGRSQRPKHSDPRRANGYRRSALRRKVAARGEPCAICGRAIDYTLTTYRDPNDGKVKRHPLSFELDEIIPVSKGGNPFDESNVQPTHRICNQKKGNKTAFDNRFDCGARENPSVKTSRNW